MTPHSACTWWYGRQSAAFAIPACTHAPVQVLRGYTGDRSARPVFEGSTPFDVLGPGYQRPFELATLRLSNMIGILPKCARLLRASCCGPSFQHEFGPEGPVLLFACNCRDCGCGPNTCCSLAAAWHGDAPVMQSMLLQSGEDDILGVP